MCAGGVRQGRPDIQSKADNAQSLLDDQDAYAEHCELIENYENQQNCQAPKRRKVRIGKGDDSMEVDAPKTEVTKVGGTVLEARKCLGVFWPVKVFFEHEKRKPTKKELVSIMHNGETNSRV